jgi:hypothetical protein
MLTIIFFLVFFVQSLLASPTASPTKVPTASPTKVLDPCERRERRARRIRRARSVRRGGTFGDPHFVMWDQKGFSFHGECDLVYFNSTFASGGGMIIQLRTEIRNHWSFIRSMAIRVENQTFEIEKKDEPGMNFYYNGEPIGENISTLAGYQVLKAEVDAGWCEKRCSQEGLHRIVFEDHGYLDFYEWGNSSNSVLNVDLSLDNRSALYNESVGLMGNGKVSGFVLRNGSILNGSILESANLFGQNWQVLDTEPMLFHKERSPQYPERCIMPTLHPPPISEERRNMSQSACSDLCGSNKDICIFDVEATGDETMAQLVSHHDFGGRNAGGFGDPHFVMWNQKHFSFHGQCDLVFYSNSKFASGAGMIIQLRTEIRDHWSFIRSMAIRVGDQTFEIEKKDGPGMNFYYNGKAVGQPISTLAGYQVLKAEVVDKEWCGKRCSMFEVYRIDFKGHGHLEFHGWTNPILHMDLSSETLCTSGPCNISALGNGFPFYHGSVGLVGNYQVSGFVARNGTLLESANVFGQNWQVLDTEPMLFHKERHPQYPEPCIMPKRSARRITNQEIRNMAQTVCSHLSDSLLDMCIFDVEATGDEIMALSPFYV